MQTKKTCVVSVMAFVIGLFIQASLADESKEIVIFQKEIKGGKRLVITQSQSIHSDSLPPELSDLGEVSVPKYMSTISIELLAHGSPSCTLWSRFGETHSYHILDLLLTKNKIILAILVDSGHIEFWSVNLKDNGSLQLDTPEPALWRALAVGDVGTVSCNLTVDQKSGEIIATISDQVAKGTQESVLRQSGREWKFALQKPGNETRTRLVFP